MPDIRARPLGFVVRSVRALLVLCCALLSTTGIAQQPPEGLPTDRLIVKFRDGSAGLAQSRAAVDRRISRAQLRRFSLHAGIEITPLRVMSGEAQVLRLPAKLAPGDAQRIAARLARHPEVLFAVADQRRHIRLTPDDSYFAPWQSKPLGLLNIPRTWDETTGSPDLVVAVIDTGVLPHPDFGNRLLAGYDFVSESYAAGDGGSRDASAADPGDWVSWADVNDPASPFDSGCLYDGLYEVPSSWHGTQMAGIIGAAGNNKIGIAGINWNAKILPVRVLGKCGGYDSDIIDGMRWAAGLAVPNTPANATPARVINMSLGGDGACNSPYQTAINEITALGKVIVVAAGNENVDFTTTTPAGCQGVIAVASMFKQAEGTVAENLARSFFSNYGTAANTNLFATPGNSIYSTSDGGIRQSANDGTYSRSWGTSAAAAHMSGLVSLMLSVNPSLTPTEVQTLLRSASASLGDWSGSGLPDALLAVGNARAYKSPSTVPVSLSISGPASLFSGQAGTYSATVTWSDASTSTVFPAWSVSPNPNAAKLIDSAGRLLIGTYSDQSVAVQAGFSMNGVTVSASRAVDILVNRVVGVTVSGPATVNINDPAPARYVATATWRDGTVRLANPVWTTSAGAIGTSGFLYPPQTLGDLSVTATDGGISGSAPVSIVSTPPVAMPTLTWTCPNEDLTGQILGQLKSLDVGGGGDIVPLCEGKVVVPDMRGKRITVLDVKTGRVAQIWNLEKQPYRLALLPESGKLFATMLGSNRIASINLATGQLAYLQIHANGTATELANGEPGQLLVLHNTSIPFQSDGLAIVDAASGTVTQRTLPTFATGIAYSRSQRILLANGAYDFNPVTLQLTPRASAVNIKALTAISPDGLRFVNGTGEFDTRNPDVFYRNLAAAGSYSPDGKSFVGTSIFPKAPLYVLGSESPMPRQTWNVSEHCDSAEYRVTRFSPGGAYVYGYETCGTSADFGRLFWLALRPEPTPEPIRFDAQIGLTPAATAISGSVTLSGFSGTANISIAGGEYSVDGQNFTAAPGTAIAGQTLRVRTLAPATPHGVNAATLTVGNSSTSFLASTGAPLAQEWWKGECSSEANLGAPGLQYVDIFTARDMIALCDGRLLIDNTNQASIDLFDVRAGATIKSWKLPGAAFALRMVPGTSTLLVILDRVRLITRIDLSSGDVVNLPTDGPVSDLAPGEPGEMFVIDSQGMALYSTLTGAVLKRGLGSVYRVGSQVRYHAATRTLITEGQRYRYSPVDRSTALEEIVDDDFTTTIFQPFGVVLTDLASCCGSRDITLSPDGTRMVLPAGDVKPALADFDPQSLANIRGLWFTGEKTVATDFSRDSSRLLTGNEAFGFPPATIQLFESANRAHQRTWVLPDCGSADRKIARVRLSGSGGYAFSINNCDFGRAQLSWVPTASPSTLPYPNPVAFAPKGDVPAGVDIESNEIIITGIAGTFVPVSSAGLGWKRDGFTQFGASGWATDGSRIRVTLRSAAQPGVTRTGMLNIGGALIPFSVTTGSGTDTSPDPFALWNLKRQPLDSPILSNTLVVSGTTGPTPVSIVGGMVSIDGGAFTASPGTVNAGQRVVVRQTSANTVGTTRNTTLTIGDQSAVFTVTTGADPVYSVNVSVSGGGTVTSNPPGINCGSTCSQTYSTGAGLTLIATPTSGQVFTGWSGDCGGTGNCALTLANASKNVVATFASVPGAPTGATAAAGNASASVSFNAPASDGGAAITQYTVTASPGGASATGSASPVAVPGLTNGVAYTFTVKATNAAGSGPDSAPSAAVTPSGPASSLTLLPASIDFGRVDKGVASKTRTLTVTNASAQTVTFSSIASSGDFTRVGGSCAASLAPAASCTVSLRLRPSALGLRSASLSISSNAPGSPHSVPLTANAVALNDLAMDFGASIGTYARLNDSTWAQISASSAKSITRADLDNNGVDDLVVDFGAQGGLQVWMNNASLVPLYWQTAKSVTRADLDNNGHDDLVIDFGDGIGIYAWMNNAAWVQLYWLSAKSIIRADMDNNGHDDLVIDFGTGIGIYRWMNNAAWAQLYWLSANTIIRADMDNNGHDDLVIDFGAGIGIYKWMNNASFVQLYWLPALSILRADMDNNGHDDLVIDFGPGIGIYKWMNNASFVQLYWQSAASITRADMDGNGHDDLVINFGSNIPGLYKWLNNTSWVPLYHIQAGSITPAALDTP